MNKHVKHPVSLFLFLFILIPLFGQGTITDLRLMGYAISPAPQQVNLDGENVIIDDSWQIMPEKTTSKLISKALTKRSQDLFGLVFSGTGTGQIELKITQDAVPGISDPECSKQAYRISISQDRVIIEGNDDVGLFYGIQSFLQLLKPVSDRRFKLPTGTISDWPDLELRVIHWGEGTHPSLLEFEFERFRQKYRRGT